MISDAIRAIAMEIGFVSAHTHHIHVKQIVAMIRMVFNALRENAVFDFQQPELSRQMQAAGQALAEDGFVLAPMPIDVLLLQRKFGGMFLLANRLSARVPVMDLLGTYLVS